MKTEKEIREKYEEMLERTELLMDKVRNFDKYNDVTIENIQEHIQKDKLQQELLLKRYQISSLCLSYLRLKP